jgi:diaminopimelate epimerase
MHYKFTKMEGLGNDFIVFDAVTHALELDSELIRRLADRHYGVGCDQVLIAEPSADPKLDFRYRIFNADGSEVEQCGNGARCFARFVRDSGLTEKSELRVGTKTGELELHLRDDGLVAVNMGEPRFEPARIPFVAEVRADRYEIDVAGERVELGAVSMLNPHAVITVDDVDTAPVERLGPLVETHASFPQRVNVGFSQRVSDRLIRLRVFERGVGETLACGSGACAAVAVGRSRGELAETVTVELRGGQLVISWQGAGNPLWMTGPATRVFEGRIEL